MFDIIYTRSYLKGSIDSLAGRALLSSLFHTRLGCACAQLGNTRTCFSNSNERDVEEAMNDFKQ